MGVYCDRYIMLTSLKPTKTKMILRLNQSTKFFVFTTSQRISNIE